jgi:hypothetical protein
VTALQWGRHLILADTPGPNVHRAYNLGAKNVRPFAISLKKTQSNYGHE